MNALKQIIFIESSPTDMLAKMSRLLKKNGYYTILITLTGDLKENFIKESYDETISFDSKFFKINFKNIPLIILDRLKKGPSFLRILSKIKSFRPHVIIGRSTPNWLCFLSKKYFKNFPFVYFPYDIRSFAYDSKEKAISEIPKFELKAERYCFEKSDGIIHKGDENELEFLDPNILGKNIKINSPIINFQPYCSKELMAPLNKKGKLSIKDKRTHIVNIGHVEIIPETINHIKEILDEGFCVHFYGKSANLKKEDFYASIRSAYGDILDGKNLYLHEPVTQKELSKEISKYDYGIVIGPDNKNKKNVTLITANKVSSYLEAGLPIICLKNNRVIYSLIKSYNIGVGVDSKELQKLKSFLKNENYNRFLNNVKVARDIYSMEENMPRLEKFFEDVRKHKYKL